LNQCTGGLCGGTTTGQPTGSACTQSSDCAGSTDLLFTTDKCAHSTNADGSASGWVGGYCAPSCLTILGTATCPSTSDYCNGLNCYQACSAPGAGQSNCRPNYVCVADTVDGGVVPGSARCLRNCHNAGAGCSSPSTCNALGYCQ
jgi:hypothetical protein